MSINLMRRMESDRNGTVLEHSVDDEAVPKCIADRVSASTFNLLTLTLFTT